MTYITFWPYGLCSGHRTLAAAIREAKRRERAGFAPLKIAKVVPRSQWAKQKCRHKLAARRGE